MANKATLEAEILSLCNTAKSGGMSEATFAADMATAFDNYIKTFIVNIGITVQVNTGTGTGATTETGTLS